MSDKDRIAETSEPQLPRTTIDLSGCGCFTFILCLLLINPITQLIREAALWIARQ